MRTNTMNSYRSAVRFGRSLLTIAFVLSVACASYLVAQDESASHQRVVLRGGNSIEGKVVKRTQKAVFVDVGYTILSVPSEEVDEIVEPKANDATGGTNDPSAKKAPAGSEKQDAIFFTKNLEPGTVKEKSRQVSESVVHVLTLSGSGSGFCVNEKEGYIVTNYHVVEREREISIVIYIRNKDGLRKQKIEKMDIVALNPFFDLALLKVPEPASVPLKKAYLGDYQRVRPGDPVFAIGNPLGLDRTVSDGIVSNRNRALRGVLSIQTTAPINPGNSGGPLFNNRGEVIGVTSSKLLGGESLGFAIPIHYVKDFLRYKEAYAFDKDNPNTGVRYLQPPGKRGLQPPAKKKSSATKSDKSQKSSTKSSTK